MSKREAIRQAVLRSGFPLQMEISGVLRKRDYEVYNGVYFFDPDEKKAREFDIEGINYMLHWNGTSWNKIESPKIVGTGTLWAVSMTSSTEGWTVGDGGIIIKWDGKTWQNVTSPVPTNVALFSVDAISSNDAWAVGMEGTIIQWDGTSWNNVASPTGSWLQSVDFVNSNDGWIVGADGNIFQWTTQPPPFPWIPLVVIATIVVAATTVAFFFTRKHVHQAEQHI